MKKISIVIPIYNRLEITKKGLKYINDSIIHFHTQDDFKEYQISMVIVDDGSTDGSAEWIQENYPGIEVIKSEGNLYWTGAVNLGIAHCLQNFQNLEAIILQNDDIIIYEDWVFNLVSAAHANPKSLIGCATSLLDSKELIIYGGRDLNPWFATEKKTNFQVSKKSFAKGYVSPSFDLYGRGLYIPSTVFNEIGLFNAHQLKHRGDTDIPLRAKKAGYKLLVSYDAIVYELPEHSFELDSKLKLSFKEAKNLLTDFRSSHNLKVIYYCSVNATSNPFQFAVFFTSNLFYNLRRICWRLIN